MKVKNLNSHIEHIISGYKQQYPYYKQLLQLSLKMQTIVFDTNIEEIEQIFTARIEVINNIEEIEKNIVSHKEAVMNLLHLKEFNLEKVLDLIYADLKKELYEQKEVLEQLINAIIESDRKNEEVLNNQLKDNVSEQIRIKQHFGIQQVYLDRPEKYPEPRFFDKIK